MKIKRFIAKLRMGDNTTTVITIPTSFRKINGLVLGEEYIFEIVE